MKDSSWFARLLANSRFWILATAIIASIDIAGFIQLSVPSGTLQIIRIEQIYGFLSLVLLYVAIITSPLIQAFPRMPGAKHYLHARRAIGVSAFYYGLLHSATAFFLQLGGFNGLSYLNQTFKISLLAAICTLAVLFVMTATSLDWAVKKMGFKNWKLLHRLVYLASLTLLLHISLIGSHFANRVTPQGILLGIAIIFLLWLEALRVWRTIHSKRSRQ